MLRAWRIPLVVLVLVGALVASALPSAASSPRRLQDVQERLSRAKERRDRATRQAGVLSSQVAAAGQRVAALDQRLASLRGREAQVTRRLDAELSQLAQTQDGLRRERARLTRLRARLAEGRRRLAARLVELYKADSPDMITVLLNADGFAQLLEDASFMRRISQQDKQILTFVANAQRESRRKADQLAGLERRQAAVAKSIEDDRAALVAVRQEVESTRASSDAARDARRRQLASVQVSASDLRDEVRSLEKVQARVATELQQASAASPVAGPPATGSGRMIWPITGPITSPFCERRSYEACHPGLDIAAPDGTPIKAAAAGTVVLMQPVAASGGYGNYTCIEHSGGLSTCYAHQSRFGTSVGAKVAQGQIIGYVGNTGNSFGAHLHFEVRVNGAVTNPLNYL